MSWTGLKKARWIAAISLIAAAATFTVWRFSRSKPEDRLYRIGWASNPPFQQRGEDGQATGFAVELVREAARRRGIRLEWVEQDLNSDIALRSKSVDLWPLIVITPERKKVIHISDPYFETAFSYVVRANSAYKRPEDLAHARISYADLPISHKIVHESLPGARLLPRSATREVLDEVCLQNADAAFLDEHAAIAAMLGGSVCANHPLRLISTPGRRPIEGIGSTFEASAAADALREEIGVIAAEGHLAGVLSRGGYFSGRTPQSVEAMLQAARRERWLTVGIAAATFLLMLTLWQAFRIRRERNKAKRAEQALRTSEERLALALDATSDGLYDWDLQTGRIYISPRYFTMLGYEPDELTPSQAWFLDILHPDDQESTAAELREYQENRRDSHSSEIRLKAKSGEWRWILSRGRAVRREGGRQRPRLIGTHVDITGPKLAEAALKASEERFRSVIDMTKEWIWEMDLEGRHTYSSPMSETISGYRPDELIGQPVVEFIHEDDWKTIQEKLPQLLSEKRGWTGWVIRWRHKQGGYRYLESTATPILNAAGELIGYRGAGRDITDKKTLEEQLQQSQKLESIGRLAGGVAHDFNNLLTVIAGYCDLLWNLLQEGDALRDYVAEIRDAAERATGLTQQLLTFSRKQVIQLKAINLNEVVAGAERMLRRLVGEDIEFVTLLDPALGWVLADHGQVHQVLMNLSVNARDAMPDGGRLTIATANIDLPDGKAGEHASLPAGAFVSLTVTDTGVGMDEATRQRIFEPFFTTKEVGKGTGLGLSTIYGIVQQIHGQIEVASEPGKGTSFKIYWPRVDTAELAEEAIQAGPPCALGSETILLVEDQVEVRRLSALILKQHGYKVLEAAGGAEALALISQSAEPIHLLLTDLVMPGMNGRQLAEQLKILRPGIKVLYTSGYDEDLVANRGLMDEGVAYIPKPFGPDALAQKVREALGF